MGGKGGYDSYWNLAGFNPGFSFIGSGKGKGKGGWTSLSTGKGKGEKGKWGKKASGKGFGKGGDQQGKGHENEMTTCPTPGCGMKWKASSNPSYCFRCWQTPKAEAKEFDATALLENLLSEGVPRDRASKLLSDYGLKFKRAKEKK